MSQDMRVHTHTHAHTIAMYIIALDLQPGYFLQIRGILSIGTLMHVGRRSRSEGRQSLTINFGTP